MPQLELLNSDALVFVDTVGELSQSDLDNLEIKQCNIKSLTVPVYSRYKHDGQMDQINDIFRFMLDSCPFLQKFHVRG